MTIPRSLRLLVLAIASTAAVTAGVHAWMQSEDDVDQVLPADPSKSPVELLLAEPFVLDRPATHWYRAEQPTYTAGYLLVLKVDPKLVVARQTFMPVLYVGSETAEPVNVGEGSGRLVVIVPATAGPDGEPRLDLARSPIFFGTPDLPERVTQASARAQLADALNHGVVAPSAAAIAAAERPLVRFADDDALRLQATDLIEVYAPDEVDLVNGLRVPRIR